MISASFASIAGAIQAWYLGYIDPTVVFGLDVALVPIVMALFGGTGTLLGPLVGVLTLGLIEQFIWIKIPFLHFAIYGAILIGVGLFMPGGMVRSGWFQKLFFRQNKVVILRGEDG